MEKKKKRGAGGEKRELQSEQREKIQRRRK